VDRRTIVRAESNPIAIATIVFNKAAIMVGPAELSSNTVIRIKGKIAATSGKIGIAMAVSATGQFCCRREDFDIGDDAVECDGNGLRCATTNGYEAYFSDASGARLRRTVDLGGRTFSVMSGVARRISRPGGGPGTRCRDRYCARRSHRLGGPPARANGDPPGRATRTLRSPPCPPASATVPKQMYSTSAYPGGNR
jgi:hypothetical protein